MPAKIISTPNASELTYELVVASDASDTTFIIGDSSGIGAAAIGGTMHNPTTVNGNAALVAPNKALFASRGMIIGAINIETSTDKTQFNNQLKLYGVNHNGDLNTESVAFKGSNRGNQFDQLIKSVNVEFAMDATRFITLMVKAGQTVTLTLKPTAYQD